MMDVIILTVFFRTSGSDRRAGPVSLRFSASEREASVTVALVELQMSAYTM